MTDSTRADAGSHTRIDDEGGGSTGLSELLGRKEETSPPTKYIQINTKEVRNNFSEITHAIDFKNERVVVLHRGKAKVALVPINDLKRLDEIQSVIKAEQLSKEEKLIHISKLFEDESDDTGGSDDVSVSGTTRVRKRGAGT